MTFPTTMHLLARSFTEISAYTNPDFLMIAEMNLSFPDTFQVN